MSARWAVEDQTGSAAAFHRRPLPDAVARAIWSFTVDRPALVLGSAQRADVVDGAAAARAGVEVVRRRSGGGAVLLVPGEVTWIDVILPAGDPLWQDDVGRAFDWLGEAWAATLVALGAGHPEVHRGALVGSRWSGLVCFGGLGRGEVTLCGHKVLGLSQRRTRRGARFQCALLHRWDPQALLDLLVLDPIERREALTDLREAAAGVPAPDGRPDPAGDVLGTLLANLPGAGGGSARHPRFS